MKQAGKKQGSMTVDVAIVGAGPGGAAAAVELGKNGMSCALVDREPFPRFHIGESLSGEVGRVMRGWGLADKMDADEHVVKRGTYVYGAKDNSFYIPVVAIEGEERRRVRSQTWQVDRSKFDKMLLDLAVAEGAELIAAPATEPIVDENNVVTGIRVGIDGETEINSSYVIDASGMGRFMQKSGLTGEIVHGGYTKQVAFFTHLRGVDRGEGEEGEHTRIFYGGPDHWSWLIPVDPDLTSIGIVVPSSYFRSMNESPDDFVLREMRELHPHLAARVEDATVEFGVKVTRNYSYQIHDFTGPGWVCVGDAHRFIDPIFSLGVNAAVQEGREAASLCIKAISGAMDPGLAHRELFLPYEEWAEGGQQVVQDLLDAFWGNPIGFGYLAHKKHHDDIVDIFSGRNYGVPEMTAGHKALRRLADSVTA